MRGLMLVVVAFFLGLGPAAAADFPTRPLRFVVPFGPGGASDQLARMLGTKLSERLKQPVVIDNKPGAGTALGILNVRQAESDGHTFLLGGTSGVVNQALDPGVGFNVSADFATVSVVGEIPYILVVNPQVPARSIAELAALLRNEPGRYNYASGGLGSSNHFATELLLTMSGTRATHIPYNSSAAAIASVISGETHFTFDTPITAKAQIAAGKVRALGASTAARARALPDIPTLAESGVPGYEVTGFFAVTVPARTPREVIAVLNREIVAMRPAVVQALRQEGLK